MFVERYKKNPILAPKSIHSWEAFATFNPCPIQKGKKIYLVFRALSLPHFHAVANTTLEVSNIGITPSKDGIDFHDRKAFIVPEEPWEKFGCEDPKITKLNNKYFIFYTALSTFPFSPEGIRVGVAISKDLKKIEQKHLVTPFNAKAMALFPEKINNRIWGILTVNTDRPPAYICLVSFKKEKEIWNEKFWKKWYANFEKHCLKLQRNPGDQIEVGATPIKTKYGWLLIYAYIRDYFSPHRLFGTEIILLDLQDPRKIIAKLDRPLLVPEEYYEKIGRVPNVVFPSGALLKKDTIYLYYGASDTTGCLAFIKLPNLIEKLFRKEKVAKFIRPKNPIIFPNPQHSWEAKATFNPGAIYLRKKVHLVYRAMSKENVSVLGYATSKDGINIDYRSKNPIYLPRESFEQKQIPRANSGCEDPRLTKIQGKIYMCYTAFDGKNPPRVALTWIKEKDFLEQQWKWVKPVLISMPMESDKDAFIFPEKINGKYFIIHRIGNDLDSALVSSLNFDGKTWIEEYRWVVPRKGRWDSQKVGGVAPPIKTNQGWIMFYHGMSENKVYKVGAILLDKKNPLKIIARTDEPILEPETEFEKKDLTPNVVFPCGTVVIKDKIFMYYGAADQVVRVATIKINDIIDYLKSCKL